jgi:hypothetical protein
MPQFPSWLAGQRITAEQLLAGLPYMAVKPGATSVTSSTTLITDPDLQLVLPGPGTYVIDGYLNYTGSSVGAGDIKGTFEYSGGINFANWDFQAIATTGGVQMCTGPNAFGIAVARGTDGGTWMGAHLLGLLVATSGGTLSWNWAQNTSNATSTNIRQGSWIRAFQQA